MYLAWHIAIDHDYFLNDLLNLNIDSATPYGVNIGIL